MAPIGHRGPGDSATDDKKQRMGFFHPYRTGFAQLRLRGQEGGRCD
ncbi:protein of unknown function [Cupriavidus taiwanensis]|uniref:Uncharacterized protein n=1 Tax=Cupriavidus taiwanensis TaxID=164546 RepID=A0A7Z7J8F2_9BURK|nr:protein of unknown function [Cupriavidus taiwanensis]SOZ01444.1 hypothetical protein CBM2595_A30306 [Cupriavidus taiwanensis]SOZ04339.1 hypothetical protein CBM2597_A50452 [Cupriavidus taiwanensis]SPC08980.1 hypothetical protein CBM2594_A40303 [Cupriavidus taiwanensis]SPD38773.1 protein of unknown function [Cupriavidus taiwanensis]